MGDRQHHSEDGEKSAARRWTNVTDFIDWISRRCGGELRNEGGTFESEEQTVLQVA